MKCRRRISGVVAVLAALVLLGPAEPRAGELLPDDLDKSGAVDATDLVLLANFQAGNLNSMPAQFGQLWEADPIVGGLRRVPAGKFTQGSPEDEPCNGSNETQFTHTLTRDFAVMETEVTRLMWATLLAVQPTLPADPTDTSVGAGMSNPVQNVTWYAAVLFANLLSAERGLTRCYYTDAVFTTPIDAANYTGGPFYCNFDASGYRLLSEGEWEYACRAETATPFWIAESNYSEITCWDTADPGMFPALETAAWFWGNSSSLFASSPVATKQANPWGLHDTHGNVREWCWDWDGTYPAGSATDYSGPSEGTERMTRGGGWYDHEARHCRSAYRGSESPGTQSGYLGFRLAKSLP